MSRSGNRWCSKTGEIQGSGRSHLDHVLTFCDVEPERADDADLEAHQPEHLNGSGSAIPPMSTIRPPRLSALMPASEVELGHLGPQRR